MKLLQGIFGNIIKQNLPALIDELKKEAPALIKEYLPKLIDEHKEKMPEYLEKLKAFAIEQLRHFDFNANGIPDIDEYHGDFDEVVGHLSAVFGVALRVKDRVEATKKGLEKKEGENAKTSE